MSKVVVIVDGGVVQEVLADREVDVYILDGDLHPTDLHLWGKDWKLLVGGEYRAEVLDEALEAITEAQRSGSDVLL